jgi:Raf kinase inhibitor-like YbhB/YbcL family protein
MPIPLLLAAAFTLTSPAFRTGTALPRSGAQAACGGGASTSPPLRWSDVPAYARSFAVVLDDPDAPVPGGFVHWVAYGIPASTTALPAGAGARATGYVAGVNSAGARTFTGYCPPPGDAPHAYRFTVYATDYTPEALPPSLTRDALLSLLAGHVKGRAVLVGRYGQ